MNTITKIFLFLALMYSTLFALLAFVPISIDTESATNQTITTESDGFFVWLLGKTSWGQEILPHFSNVNTRITNLHPLFQILLFTPVAILLTWLIILLVVWIIPFIGGGS